MVSVAVRNPDLAWLAAMREALGSRGIAVDGGVRAADPAPPSVAMGAGPSMAGAAPDTLFSVASPPLREVMPALDKPSQNQIAELLLKTLGLERTGIGTADSGRRVVERQLLAWGADSSGFAVRDGSGLSRHDYLSPETLVHVLAAARRDTAWQVMYEALPIAGLDGTIGRRMIGTAAAGNVHAKTGSVDKARSLSGFVTTADGRMLIFSILSNNWTVPARDIESVADTICERLAVLQLGGTR
jgi:D-alanyl-D-alanine carboxypeptidase/D-alanyl-D-alanine-endopeptidase (penicillin-binding protein 4)